MPRGFVSVTCAVIAFYFRWNCLHPVLHCNVTSCPGFLCKALCLCNVCRHCDRCNCKWMGSVFPRDRNRSTPAPPTPSRPCAVLTLFLCDACDWNTMAVGDWGNVCTWYGQVPFQNQPFHFNLLKASQGTFGERTLLKSIHESANLGIPLAKFPTQNRRQRYHYNALS